MQYILSVIYQFLEENYFSNTLDGQYDYLDFSGTNTTLLILVGGLCIGVLIASVMMYYQSNVVGTFVRRLLSDKIFSAKEAKTLSELGLEKSSAIKTEMRSRSSVLRKLVSYEEDGVVYDYRTELAHRLGVPVESIEQMAAEEAAAREKKSLKARLSRLFAKKKAEAPADSTNETPTENTATAAEENPLAAKENTTAAEEASLETVKAEIQTETETAPEKRSAKAVLRGVFGKSAALSVRAPDFTKARFFIPEELSYRADLRYGKKRVSIRALILTFVFIIVFFFLSLRLIPVFVSMLDATIGNVAGGVQRR